jgi:hypothetical protein
MKGLNILKGFLILITLVIPVILIVKLSFNKDNWKPDIISTLDTPVPQFPKGYSLLTINSDNGNLDTSLSDDQMNKYFNAINDKVQQLLDSATKNMQSMQDAFKKQTTQNAQFQKTINDQIGGMKDDIEHNGNNIVRNQNGLNEIDDAVGELVKWKNQCRCN